MCDLSVSFHTTECTGGNFTKNYINDDRGNYTYILCFITLFAFLQIPKDTSHKTHLLLVYYPIGGWLSSHFRLQRRTTPGSSLQSHLFPNHPSVPVRDERWSYPGPMYYTMLLCVILVVLVFLCLWLFILSSNNKISFRIFVRLNLNRVVDHFSKYYYY